MKKLILLLLALLPLNSFSQLSFSFENGLSEGWHFSSEGHWAVDNNTPLSGIYSLHHAFNSPVASSDAASFSISDLCLSCSITTWSFILRHGYLPSSSNRWAFVLTADLNPGDLKSATGYNGFVTGVNISGYDDTLRLYSVEGSTLRKIITTKINWEKDIGVSVAAKITAIRKISGEWTLKVETTDGLLKGEWSGYDSRETNSLSAGIIYSYTSSADQLLWLDDVSVTGTFVKDTLPPEIISVKTISYKTLQVTFNEDIKNGLLEPSSVEVNSVSTAVNCRRLSSCVYEVNLSTPVLNKSKNTLSISDVCDIHDNCEEKLSFQFIPSFADIGDVVIDEIMFDPVPSVLLPEDEYIEILNRTEYSFSTAGWMLIAGNDTSFFPQTTLEPGAINIVCSITDTSVFKKYGRVTGLRKFPVLKDSGEKIALRDASGKLIHALVFGPVLYNNGARSGGGWSVEMTDTGNPFNTSMVWMASLDPSGGTPGRKNSVEQKADDDLCPEVVTVFPHDSSGIEIWFNETVRHDIAPDRFLTNGLNVVSVIPVDIADMCLLLKFDSKLSDGKVYTLSLPLEMTDFAGNATCEASVCFGIPEKVEAGGLLFNELLFNPAAPCGDYIELYNNSSSVVDLSDYYFTSTNPDTGEESAVVRACSNPRLIFPGGLMALTTDKAAVLSSYPCSVKERISETAELPSMPDDEGVLSVYDKSLNLIDRVRYTHSMHMSFISGEEGISLEKVDPSFQSMTESNWHSASEGCNWGTPGAPNSVIINDEGTADGVTLSSDRVSPDGDGYEDVVSVNIFPGGEDNVATVYIFNYAGYLVRKLTERFSIGTGASIVWDGSGDDKRIPDRGLYLISVTVYSPKGIKGHWKKICAVLY